MTEEDVCEELGPEAKLLHPLITVTSTGDAHRQEGAPMQGVSIEAMPLGRRDIPTIPNL